MLYLQQTNLTDYCIWHLVCSVNWCIFRLPELGNPGLSAGPLASINGCHQSLDATLQHYSPDLGQEPGPRLVWTHSGLHPRKFHYHNINTSRCQDLAGFLFTLLLWSLFLLWSSVNPLGQVGPGAVWPEVSDEFYMRLLWTSEWSTEPGCRAVNVYIKMGTYFM